MACTQCEFDLPIMTVSYIALHIRAAEGSSGVQQGVDGAVVGEMDQGPGIMETLTVEEWHALMHSCPRRRA